MHTAIRRGLHWVLAPPFCSARPAVCTARRRCTAAGVRDGLGWVDPATRKDVARVLELAERASQRWEVEWTDFLPPSVVADSMAALTGRTDVVCIPWGGYAQAERCRLALGREEVMEALRADPNQLDGVAALQVTGNFMFDPAKHPDFLGAILGTGVVRERVGDVLVQGEGGAQVLVDPELLEHFEMALVQVRTVPVSTRRMALSELAVRPARQEEVSSVEASMRLDAIASAGFRVSRSKMGDLIKAGDVRLNWRPAAKTSAEVKAGDVISCTGKGRLEVKAVDVTKKERFYVTLLRFV
ncbi:putative RNA-binding protein ylmH [Tetrabaena socialis]|uniref:Putative RNA-binding protein ylmH n=1 Tax=Tetrabaena socialis TaxID=47790 RepID=A0A2J7ZVJ0_9CHLO|nr:putative RNA-binding protein ylmH [Tetrabaena socialis]|eukprot:PNH04282.1 putative RNA-binding protein ylmH [Tetrabaena socialis]